MTRWSFEEDGGSLILRARGAPVRWDITASRDLPALPDSPRARRRLAHQVRQDIWRALQRVRGFVPLVSVETPPGFTRLSAGGTVLVRSPVPAGLRETVATILDNDKNRRRWLAHACRAEGR